MMVLSRLWYFVLALLLGIATYVVYLAVGEYDRRNSVAMEEELASDSQTVGWALQIDARKRLDALLIGAVDKAVQDALLGATGKDTVPGKAKEDGRRALNSILDKIPADFKPDAVFAVDHDGRVVSQVGFDSANAFPDFELGGYPAVFDALHGYLRDDTWVFGGKPYRVVARPVEFDSTQPPLGAIVALKAVDAKFAADISKRTRTNVVFFAAGGRLAASTVPGFDGARLTRLDSDLASLATDKSYQDGRSDVRLLGDDLGVIYARFVGDAWGLGAGFAVVRTHAVIGGPLGFLNGADDKDKAAVNNLLIGGIVLAGILIGILFSLLEHTLPQREMVKQAAGLRKGQLDYLQIARFRGAFRGIAQDLNAGIERVLEKGGGAARKPADLESILGPVPAQPAMSAFSFPLPDGGGSAPRSSPAFVPPQSAPGPASVPQPGPQSVKGVLEQPKTVPLPPPNARTQAAAFPAATTLPGAGPASGGRPGADGVAAAGFVTPRASSPAFPPAGPPIPLPIGAVARPGGAQLAPPITPLGTPADAVDGDGPTMAAAFSPKSAPSAPSPISAGQAAGPASSGAGPGAGLAPTGGGPAAPGAAGPPGPPPPARRSRPDAAPPAASLGMGMGSPGMAAAPARPGDMMAKQTMLGMGLQAQHAARAGKIEEEEATVIGRAPNEILAEASGHNEAVSEETAEWTTVYDEFLRTKKQCSEPTEGLTFEKFQNTLRKNRDALVQRHHCKRVRFSVYVKDGRASLKATPVKE